MFSWLGSLLSTEGFPPRWFCGPAWQQHPEWGWLHILSDLFVWGAYMAIPLVLVFFLYQRRDIPFPRVMWLFAGFILACGTSHLVEAIIFWYPVYRLSGIVKFLTAGVSWLTVAALIPVIPRVLAFRSPDELRGEIADQTERLREANRQLAEENRHRRSIEAELRDSQEQLRLALTAGKMGTWVWDIESDEVRFDAAQIRLTGLDPEGDTISIEEFFQRIHPEDLPAVQKSLEEARESSSNYEAQFRFARPNGGTRWLVGRGISLQNAHGETRRMVGINFDITEQVQREQVLERAEQRALEASRYKSEFLANMSHEIRTPLTALIGCVDSLYQEVTDDEQRKMLAIMRGQSQLLLGILNDVLDLSKIEAGKLEIKLEAAPLPSIIHDVRSLLGPLASEQDLELHTEFTTPVPKELVTDPLRLRQILLNLTSNAIKFTPAGSVTVTTRTRKIDGQHQLEILIEDTGVGISDEQLTAIFQAFDRGDVPPGDRRGGTGLGLAISRRLVELLGGTIEVESHVGQGSRFTVILPLDPASCGALIAPDEAADLLDVVPAHGPSPPPRRIPARVLAAEDTRAIQLVLRRLLDASVAVLDIVGDGRRAVEQALNAERKLRPYDVLLMDMHMPEMDGFEATARLRSEGYRGAIIALTAGAMADDREKCLRAGCDEYLPKPIDQHQLLELVRRFTLPESEATLTNHD